MPETQENRPRKSLFEEKLEQTLKALVQRFGPLSSIEQIGVDDPSNLESDRTFRLDFGGGIAVMKLSLYGDTLCTGPDDEIQRPIELVLGLDYDKYTKEVNRQINRVLFQALKEHHTNNPKQKEKYSLAQDKIMAVIIALGSIHGPFDYRNVQQSFINPKDPSSVIIARVDYGGMFIKIACDINGNPTYQITDKRTNQYTSPVSILHAPESIYHKYIEELNKN